MQKRILIFFAVSLLISITISFLISLLGIGPVIFADKIAYAPLMAFCFLWGISGSIISLLFSKIIAKWSMGVQLVTLEGAHKNLVEKVHRLARRSGLTKMPEVGIYQSIEVNAFATGPSRNNSLVAISSGLLISMDESEVEGVLAHEIAHIANGDMVTMALIQGVVNAFVMFFSRIISFAIMQAMKNDDDHKTGNPLIQIMLTMFFDILFGILAMPLIAWFSRYREYRADAKGADLAGSNKMLAALVALERSYPQLLESKMDPHFRAMQISAKNSSLMSLFSSHPPLNKRIIALKNRL